MTMNVNLMMRLLPQVLFAVLLVVISIGITFTSFAEEIPLNFNSPEYHANDGYWQIEKPGNYYLAFEGDTFYTNTYSAIRIYCDDVTLDGRGKTITGSGPPSEDKGPNRCGVQVTWAYLGSDNVHIKNLKVEKKYHGILFESIYNGTLENCTTTGNNQGITLWKAEDTTLKGNMANYNQNGIVLDGYQCVNINNTIINNTANNNTLAGIILHLENAYNTISNNTANRNDHGISLADSSHDNILSGNTTSENPIGINIKESYRNVIKGNTITQNQDRGIWLYDATNNTIYDNYFSNSVENVGFDGACTGNQWNIAKTAGTNIVGGPYLGGNFWATPDGYGFSQTTPDSDGDGICDSAYTFSGNVDQFPLHAYTVPITAPTVTTSSVSAITCDAASSGGNVTSSGGASVTARGVCWSDTANPTTSNSKTTNGSGTGSFASAITDLTANTTYYVRAYATNSAGTSYGNEVSFKTLTTPTVTTTAVTAITQTSATSGGNVTSDGGDTVTARGVCWSTTDNPTTSNSKTINGTGTGAFQSTITGLNLGAAYHVRAYATNSAGTGYGADLPFATQPFEGIVYVSLNDQTCGDHCPCYTTIQAAIDAPYDAHTIKVAEGTYPEAFTLNESRVIIVEGGWNASFTSQTPNTTKIKSPTVQTGAMTFRNLIMAP